VLVVQIDVFRLESGEGVGELTFNVGGFAVGESLVNVFREGGVVTEIYGAKLGGKEDVRAAAGCGEPFA
jgi:hypothetical protein